MDTHRWASGATASIYPPANISVIPIILCRKQRSVNATYFDVSGPPAKQVAHYSCPRAWSLPGSNKISSASGCPAYTGQKEAIMRVTRMQPSLALVSALCIAVPLGAPYADPAVAHAASTGGGTGTGTGTRDANTTYYTN